MFLHPDSHPACTRCEPGRQTSDKRKRGSRRQNGFTLAELLSVTVVMVLLAGTLAALASAVQVTSDHHYSQGLAMQHGRVVLERIERTLRSATASEEFPGFFAFSYTVGPYSYPDTLVVWSPEGTAVEPDGMPRMGELVIFKADSSEPGRLLELRPTGDTREAPAISDRAAWLTELEYLQSMRSNTQTVLTDMVRTADATSGGAATYAKRGCVRFQTAVRPSEAEWTEYKTGTRTWESLSWPQDLYGSASGSRQSWCRIELQLRPVDVEDHSVEGAIPFFGSAALFYPLEK
jgi:Tfp pilus assembly protein PilW